VCVCMCVCVCVCVCMWKYSHVFNRGTIFEVECIYFFSIVSCMCCVSSMCLANLEFGLLVFNAWICSLKRV
jgi:hypothetical protein